MNDDLSACADSNWWVEKDEYFHGNRVSGIGCAEIDQEEFTCSWDGFIATVINPEEHCCACGGGDTFEPVFSSELSDGGVEISSYQFH